jgi:hypothetical protein
MKEKYREKNSFALASAFVNTGAIPVQARKTKAEIKNMNTA